MLDTLYNFEADSLFELVPALNGKFTYNEVMQFDISEYYKNFIATELKWRLLDSFIPFIQCNNISLDNDFEKTLNNFFNYSNRYAQFDGEELREILKIAVNFKIHSNFRPIELINSHFFTNNYILSKSELYIKKDYFIANSFAGDITKQFYNKFSNFDSLTPINKSDLRKFISTYTSYLLENPSNLITHLENIRSYLAEFALKLNTYHLSSLLSDLNISYLADKFRIEFKDDYVPNNNDILKLVDKTEVLANDLLQEDNGFNTTIEADYIHSFEEEDYKDSVSNSFIDQNNDFKLLDDIIEEISMNTNDNADSNMAEELASMEDEIVADSQEIYELNNNDNNTAITTPNIELNTNFEQHGNNTDIKTAIDSELQSLMDIINL